MPVRKAGTVLALILLAVNVFAQDLGHKLPGSIGLDAARVPEPGLYLVNRLAIYEADALRDRNGNRIPTAPFDLLGRANVIGFSYTRKVRSMFLSIAAGGPISDVRLNIENGPEVGVDRFGFGDPFIQPVRLGWRKERFDWVTSYSIYLPTGRSPLA